MITNKNLVFKISGATTKKEVLKELSKRLVEDGSATKASSVLKGFEEREKQSSTGMGEGIAIPHVSSKDITEIRMLVAKLDKPTDWQSLDGQPTDTVIAIAVPASGRDDHFELLTQLTGKLADPEFINKFKKMTIKQTVDFINEFKVEKKVSKVAKDAKKIVAVTTCPVGIAHTFMAAEALENAAEKAGYAIKVEKQAAIGTKDELSKKDIEEADFVIIVAGKEIEGRGRFLGKQGAERGNISKAIKEAPQIIEEATKTPQPINSGGAGGSSSTSTGSTEKASWMSHMMAGLSYMIPFVVLGGIFIALSIGIGYAPDGANGMQPKNSFWAAMNFVGVQGFILMIPILAAFTANSIAGRSAIAPAAILALAFNSGGGEATWNWFADGMGFGGFTSSPALGFLGAIVFGYLIGYTVKLFNQKVTPPRWLAPAMPIFVIPIMFTGLGWVLFTFVGYLPLYGLALGLNALLNIIKETPGMLAILGLFIGAMISFDMGGPINKIAFAFGVSMIGAGDSLNGGSVVMGMVSTSIPVAPLGAALGVLVGKLIKVEFDQEDVTNASSAGLMGLIGISEGAIPFAIKFPKVQFIANVAGGAVAGLLAGAIGITSVAAHGGPIVGLVGAIGWTHSASIIIPTILFFLVIIVAALVTATIMAFGLKFEQKKAKEALAEA